MGWKLVNTDLGNTSEIRVRNATPIASIYNGSDRSLAPIVEINTNRANRYESYELPSPVFTGYLHYLKINQNLDSLAWVNHREVEGGTPINVFPNRYWTINNQIYNYELTKALNGVSLNLVLQTYAGVTTNEIVSLRVDNFTVERIEVQGIVFTQGNQAGQFEQSGSTISIYTSNQYRINTGETIYLIGMGTYDFTYLDLAIASFIIPEASNVQEASWLGLNFTPSVNIYSPQLYEFFWSESRKLLTLFIPESSLPPAIATSYDYLSFMSNLTYDRPSN